MKITTCDICSKEIKVRLRGFKIFIKTYDNKTLSTFVHLDQAVDVCASCYDIVLGSKWESFS